MHLTPLGFDDIHLSFTQESLNKRTITELSKDILLEKIVYVTVSYFWVATEYRFLYTKIDKEKFDIKDSEMWHAKSLHICSSFIPSKSPLVNHITKSYIKHHLSRKNAKAELKEEVKESAEPDEKAVEVSTGNASETK